MGPLRDTNLSDSCTPDGCNSGAFETTGSPIFSFFNPFTPTVPPFAVRETNLSRTANVGTVGMNGLIKPTRVKKTWLFLTRHWQGIEPCELWGPNFDGCLKESNPRLHRSLQIKRCFKLFQQFCVYTFIIILFIIEVISAVKFLFVG